ncbi:hypothetical protein DMB42_42300 [Nonomuraea sp. WAC 01424]|uniref:hypothetical protein n=1 Tax=Nonomuraea sp. WAC 01424 TaxID=2203200 RepID=UPI000F785B90|nr:hypothetical protein [Nonomuraea sp. WAC 01424]RSM99535.1 hypothetical protein DMB42_42300 [Nonomuraea sp. WAC 01424]
MDETIAGGEPPRVAPPSEAVGNDPRAPRDAEPPAEDSTPAGAPRGGPGHTGDCLTVETDDPLKQCKRLSCRRVLPGRAPGKGGPPRLYCCKLCANAAARDVEAAPEAVTTHAAVTAFAAAADEVQSRLDARHAELTAEREDLRRLAAELDQVRRTMQQQLAQADQRARTAEERQPAPEDDRRQAYEQREEAARERQAAIRGHEEAVTAQREAEEVRDRAKNERDRIENQWRADIRQLGFQVGEFVNAQRSAEEHAKEQADQIQTLRTELGEAAGRAESTAAMLAEREGELRLLTDRLNAAERRRDELVTELATARTALEEATGRLENLREEAAQERRRLESVREQMREERDQERRARTEAETTAAKHVTAAETRLEVTREELQQTRHRLAAAQAATRLALPEPIDLSADFGDGVSGVVLPDVGIEAVTRGLDGAIVLHHQDVRIPLGDPEHAPAHGRALAAALLALSSERL